MAEMTFEAALAWLMGLPDWERGTGTRPAREEVLLERPALLLDALGRPQTSYRSVLIAGTKGKGSTAAMLESILRAGGLKTGLYTSPHLHSYRERIRVNGELISEDDFARGIGEIRALTDGLSGQHSELEALSTFEVMTALALEHFARQEIDVAVLEVGLGGRLDATNVVDADLALITSISFDHRAVLGDTLQKIAFEKAGIIKSGKVLLSSPQQPDALAVIERAAQEKNATLGVGERDWLWLGGHEDFMVAAEPRAGLWKNYWHYGDLHVPLLGTHQLVNAALAVAAARVMQELWGWEVGEQVVRRGLAATQWFGRLEILQKRDATHALIIGDGAHNGDSAQKLADSLKFHFEFEKVFLIFGVLGDKELDEIANPFIGRVECAWTVTTPHPRARDAGDVAMRLNEMGIKACAAESFEKALRRSCEHASPRDLILVTGSLSVVAQARAEMGLVHEQAPPL